jgi:Na+-transporting NADH:ubiquinone oxidoreductase subunit B
MVAVATAFAVIYLPKSVRGTDIIFLMWRLITRAFLFFAYPSKMSGDRYGYAPPILSEGERNGDRWLFGCYPVGTDRYYEVGGFSEFTFTYYRTTLSSVICSRFIPGRWVRFLTCYLAGSCNPDCNRVGSWKTMLSVFIGGLVAFYWSMPLPRIPLWNARTLPLPVRRIRFWSGIYATDP